ncbi:MAG: ABC transporter permease [Actinomycetota bacterium]
MILAQPRYSRDSWLDWSWVTDNTDDIYAATREHLVLTVLAVGIGLLISIPLALVAADRRRLRAPLLSVTGLLYTVPSLALLGVLVPYTGLSRTTALIPLVSYTLLILIRNIIEGLDSVPGDVREAAAGMGYTRRAIRWRIELPLAVPAIVAGVRIATVTTVGLVTVTSLIGQANLGQLMVSGFQRGFRTELMVGVLLVVIIAVVADLVLSGLQRFATPWTRRRATS